jgi:hypothetical protein
MKFKIEQVALCPEDPEAAMELLTALGAGDWAKDHVVAQGSVYGAAAATNEADLAFEYEMLSDANELEVLNYTNGPNWMSRHPNQVSHLGMHCSAEELEQFRAFFEERGYSIAQEVKTRSHENPAIAGKRWYNYVIFDTRKTLGVDLKFIVRHDQPDF